MKVVSKKGNRSSIKNLFLMACILNFVFICSCSKKPIKPNEEDKPKVGRIAIRSTANGPEFFDKTSGDVFVPMGYNYAHLQDFTWKGEPLKGHATFNSEYYDPSASENTLFKLQEAGYNTIRVFINPIAVSETKDVLENAYILNVVDFIKQADEYGIGVILTTDMISVTSYGTALKSEDDIWWWNDQYIFDEQIDLEVDFWQSLIKELKANAVSLDAIFAFEIRNEFFFHPDHYPFKGDTALVKHPNNTTYDMSVEADKTTLMEVSFIHWAKTIRNAILAEDSEALVTVGFYAPEPIGKPSIVAITKSDLDFVDLHLYAEHASLEEYNTYFDLINHKDKLIILGEFGIIEKNGKTIAKNKNDLLEWRDKLMQDYGLNGWILWTWDTNVGTELSIPDNNGVIFKAFCPKSE